MFFFLIIRRPPRSPLFPYTDALPICLPLFDMTLPPSKLGLVTNLNTRSYGITHHATPANTSAGTYSGASPDPSHSQQDRKSTRLNSSHANISYAVFCLKKKKTKCLTY